MRSLVRFISIVLLLAVVLLGLLFALENNTPISVELFIVQFEEHSVAFWLISAFSLGGVFGLFASSYSLWRMRARLLLVNRKLKLAQEELSKHRAAVIKP